MAETNAGLEVDIGISLGKLQRQLAQAEARMAATATKAEQGFKRANTSIDRGFRVSNGAANAFAGQGLRNVSLQLSQVAQQGAVSGDYLRALAIQLPDLAIGFGAVGIVIGALAGSLLPLAVNLLSSGENAEELEDRTKSLAEAVRKYDAATKAATQPTADLAAQYGNAAGQARQLFEAQRQLEQLNALAKLSEVNAGLADQFGSFADATAAQYENVGAALDILNKKLEETRRRQAENPDSVIAEGFDALAIRDQINGLGDLGRTISELSSELNVSTATATEFASALASLQASDTLDGQAEALVKVRGLFIEALGSAERMTDEQRDLYRSMVDASLAALHIASNIGAAQGAIGGAAAAATGLADEMARAAGNAAALAASGASLAREAEIKVKFAGDPVGEAKAIAAERFDSQVGDFSGFDPILKGALDDQRQSYIDNAAAAEQARQAVVEWNKAQQAAGASASRASGGGRAAGREDSSDIFAASDAQIDRLRLERQEIGESAARVAELTTRWGLLAEAKRRGLDLDAQLAGTGRTLRQEIEAQAAAVGDLAAENARAESSARMFERVQGDLRSGIADAIVDGENLQDTLAGIAKSFAKAAIEAALFGDATSGLGGGGLIGSLVGALTGRRASGGPVSAGGAYLVNENTAKSEIFVPSRNGAILTANQAQRAIAGGGSGGGSSAVHVTVGVSADSNGNLMPFVESVSQRAVGAAWSASRATMADGVARAASDPRFRGAI